MELQAQEMQLAITEYKCDLCWKTFDFHDDEDAPTWCPDCKTGVLREINVTA